jgi:hypothetical protein
MCIVIPQMYIYTLLWLLMGLGLPKQAMGWLVAPD